MLCWHVLMDRACASLFLFWGNPPSLGGRFSAACFACTMPSPCPYSHAWLFVGCMHLLRKVPHDCPSRPGSILSWAPCSGAHDDLWREAEGTLVALFLPKAG